jgi:Uma2 family endonuclease
MSTLATAPITSLSQLDPQGLYTYSDYLSWQFQERVELIRGRLFPMSPAPNTLHQRVSRELSLRIFTHFNQSTCQAFSAPFDVRLPVSLKKGQLTTVVQPDLCVICDPNKIDEQGCNGAPDLIVEILSPGNTKREMREKYQVYEESGVREYWLVHPLDREVRVYVLDQDGKFTGLAPVIEDDLLHSSVFPELEIDLTLVFAVK